MKKNYVFCEFDGAVGCEEWFDSKEKALEYANYSWNHTTEKEKAKLEWSFVIETEKTKEEVEELPGWVGDYATATIWEKGEEIKTMRYWTRDREAGNRIESFATLEEARKALAAYEEEDKKDGTYTADFYEIYDSEAEEIVK